MNNVTLTGILVKNPELRFLQNTNNAVCRFTLAVDKQLSRDKKAEMESKGQPTADFISCQAWGKMAETIAKFTEKGKRVALTGRIATGFYEAQDGSTRYTTDVVLSNVEFIDWKDNTQSTGSNNMGHTNSANPMDFMPSGDFDFGEDFDFSKDEGRIPF